MLYNIIILFLVIISIRLLVHLCEYVHLFYAGSNDDVFPAPTSPSPPPKPFILTDSLITKPQTSCVVIHRPALLKVVLLQSEAEDTKDSNQAIKRISLSGVVLNYSNTVWTLDEESQYHDEASIDSEGESDQREYYTLPGGIRSIYDPTGNSWTVLPPLPLPSPLTPTSPSSLLAPPSLVQAEAQVNNSRYARLYMYTFNVPSITTRNNNPCMV